MYDTNDSDSLPRSGATAARDAGIDAPVTGMKILIDEYIELGMTRREAVDHCAAMWIQAQVTTGAPASAH
ncbi:hypothetical protein OC846_006758 [Tilletia horrida]|uniref:Uncharacterized protein n=1 Tax=Tilletia horrida TaxID=155126 RepID=A0AAN6GI63_9BASI|nr:hypothetical protein OC846_006758 [Tilletia horrida]KAK0558799.1 hypothetical protein OC861_006827 [Tilletia horrida]